MHARNAISGLSTRGRILVAISIVALAGLVPLATIGPMPAPTAAGSKPARPARPRPGPTHVLSWPPPGAAQAAGSQAGQPAAPPNPDDVPLITFASTSSGARVLLSAPAHVALGQTVTIVLKAAGVRNLAGYEGVLRFDSAAAEFDSLSQRSIALAGSGRDVQPLGPVVVPAGVAFGLYSCSIAGCGDGPASARSHPGASGTVTLAKLTLIPTRAGSLTLALGAMRFVDASGRPVQLSLPGSVTVKVGSGGRRYQAPVASALHPSAARAVTSADISGDGLVGPADLNLAAIDWGLARESGKACGPASDPADVNHDGCLDVQDVQLIAARVTRRPAAPPLAGRFGDADAIATFVVNSTGDTGDKTPGDGICLTSAGTCTLRAAISEANLHAGPDVIDFNIPGSGVQTITIGSALPTVTDTTGGLTIDGYSQPGASVNTDPIIDNAVIEIQVTSTNPNTDGLFVSSSNNVIRGVAMYNLHRSIVFQTSSATNNAVTGSFIGTNAAGTFVAPNWISGGNGIIVTQAASYTTVGGSNPADRDVLSGNEANGFSTYNEQTDHNIVQGNLIGLAPNGKDIVSCSGICYGQLSHGVDINTGSSYNIIGGTGPGQRNVISNNRGEGIEFSHSSTTDSNQAIGNYIGTDVTGNGGAANKFGNGLNGIHLEDGTSNDILAYNVIANNALRGDGSEVMGGIGIEGFYTAGISVHDNKIGVGLDGVTPLPNNFFGVDVHFNASWVTVGPNNIIANNPIGVGVSDTTDIDNTITQNSIYNNGSAGTGLAIQLLNHANNSISAPSLSATGVSLTAASGSACAGCTVEAFKASPDPGDAAAGAAGQGKVFLGSVLVPASGAFTVGFNQTLTAGDLVTATMTDPAGNTSQFSPNVAAASLGSPTPPPSPVPTPTPGLTTYAADTFSRSLSDTWGEADQGGAYAGFYCTNDDMNVTGSAATILLPDPHNPELCSKDSTADTNYRGGYLTNVSAQDVDVRFRVATSALASGDNINVGFDVRRVSGFTSYRGQVRLTTGNQVWLQADTVINNTMTPLGSNTRAPGATVSTGGFVWVRGQVSGTNPTTIKLKAWNDGSPEPSTWAYTTTDSTPALQAPGAAGLLGWLSANWSGATPTISFDDFNVTSPISGTVPPPPVANFSATPVAGTLTVNFSNTSTGGTPDTWAWDFGDGTGSSSPSPSHTYPAAGTYQVRLSTTNNGGSSSKTQSITVSQLPGKPVAGFTWSQQSGTLGVQFSDSSTNSPSSWAWNFGDGSSTSTVQNPLHAYAAAGSYTVTLQATNGSGTGTASQTVTVSAPSTAIVSDSFNRSSAAGTWGSAPVGGAYTYVGSQADFSLTGSAGTINLGTAGATRAAYVPVSAQDVDLTYQFNIAKLPTGGGSVYAYGSVRRSATADYRVKARIFGTGAVYLSVSEFSGGTETTIGSEVLVSGLTYVPGQDLKVHAQVSGTNPTTLLARLWPAGASEPGTWLVNRTDSTAALQVAGSVGLRAYSSSTTTNNPITVAFDNLGATPLSVTPPPAPVASFTWKQASGTNTVNFSDTSTNSPTAWSWTFGDGGTSSSQNPAHTYAAAGTYTVTLTASNASGPSVPAASQSVVVTAAPSAYASDTFARTAASGTWGSAQVGGAYSYVGSQSDFSLTGSAGRMNLPTAGANRAAFLAVSAQDVDLTYQFSINALPAGGGSVYTYGTVRHSATADYRAKVRVTGTGAVYLSFSQYSGGTESTLGSEVLVSGLTYVAGTSLNVHAQVSGTSPTTLNARVWASSGSEPSSWQVSRTDSTAGLQVAGAVGLRAYTSAITTNTPISVSFDNFIAAPITQ